MCLGVGREVPNEVIEGELGWWSVRGRREYLRLVYWGEIVSGMGSNVVRGVYQEGRRRMKEGRVEKKEWCVETRRILEELGMGAEWEREDIGEMKGWKRRVKRMIWRREELRWRERMLGSGGKNAKTTLDRYMRIKKTLRPEWFLGESRVWVRRWVRMRGGVQELEVSRERWRRMRSKRICYWCNLGCVEDERHFWGECDKWKTWRRELWEELWEVDKEVVGKVVGWCAEDRVDWLMKGGNKKLRMKMMKGMTRWMYEREKMGRGKSGKEERIMMEVKKAVSDIRVGEGIDIIIGEGALAEVRKAEEVKEWYRVSLVTAIEAAIRAGYE